MKEKKETITTEFEGRSSEMRESPWMASEDILDVGDVRVTIEKVERHTNVTFDRGRSKPVVFSLSFVGKKRKLIICGETREKLKELFGRDVRKWKGQDVMLYIKPGIKVDKQIKNGIRVKQVPNNE